MLWRLAVIASKSRSVLAAAPATRCTVLLRGLPGLYVKAGQHRGVIGRTLQAARAPIDPAARAALCQRRGGQQQIDAQNRAINNSIYFQQNFDTTAQKTSGGVSSTLRTISLSPTGN